MAKRTEDIALEDMNRVDDVVSEGEQETPYNEDRPGDETMIIIDTSIPNVRRDVGIMRRSFTQDKKNFLKKVLGLKINKSDAKELFENMTLTESDGKVDGAMYKGVKVLVTQDGIIGYNSDSRELATS